MSIKKPEKQYYLSPFPKDVIGLIASSCVQKFQGAYTLELQQKQNRSLQDELIYRYFKSRAPPYELSEAERDELEKFDGNEYHLCEYRGQQFLKKYFHPEVLKFNECIEICDIENASNYKGLLILKRSMCRRKCEDKMDLTLKEYMRDGKFPKMEEILKM
ncbi:unnamed protein product [Paramecium octaurelia]|uniref:Uncharacterized protein n=1 Tax=Paramecium octaurelia TaxID=43137 RepID=A0A8S1VBZ4_PAROT|nr:unnamed protein product [Paramecium octaurelia]CAD8175098.1 unnamed protein product [Paramecium octaurelia]